ncbi:MAG TPA: nicotinamide riboside transporter PnuC, partial [Flavobacterium sp.]|nr:nicotinamide riboside transporter PnuC [Flavobacterium sp.]
MMQEILNKITWLEWLGVLFAVVQVLLARKNNVNTYLFGIAGILISLYIMFNAKLYAEFVLSLYYLVMSIYGWMFWKFGKSKSEAPVAYSDF